MKTGKSLTELAAELERQLDTKKDFVAPTRLLTLDNTGVNLTLADKGDFRLTDLGHDQVGNWAGIPAKYYDRMHKEAPDLLAANVNRWFQDKDEPRMIRTLDGNARAFLSNRYRTIDNFDIAKASLPVLLNDGQVKVMSSEVTENRLYIKAVTERLTFEVKVGDVVQMGIVISNSEVGLGAVSVEPLLYRLSCTNGAIVNNLAMKKYHVGRQNSGLDELYELFQDETRKTDDLAFMMKLQDVVKSAFDEVQFEKLRGVLVDSTTRRIEAPIDKVLDRVVEKFDLRDRERSGTLMNLVNGGDNSQWGLANAVTYLANSEQDYERATTLERIGGEIMTLPGEQWKELVNVA